MSRREITRRGNQGDAKKPPTGSTLAQRDKGCRTLVDLSHILLSAALLFAFSLFPLFTHRRRSSLYPKSLIDRAVARYFLFCESPISHPPSFQKALVGFTLQIIRLRPIHISYLLLEHISILSACLASPLLWPLSSPRWPSRFPRHQAMEVTVGMVITAMLIRPTALIALVVFPLVVRGPLGAAPAQLALRRRRTV